MNIFATLKNNWRDILTFLLLNVGCSFIADAIERYTLLDSGKTWLNNTVFVFRGMSKLATVSLASFLMLAVAWPLVNRFGNHHVKTAWDNLPQWGRLTALMALSSVYLIAAAICVAG